MKLMNAYSTFRLVVREVSTSHMSRENLSKQIQVAEFGGCWSGIWV